MKWVMNLKQTLDAWLIDFTGKLMNLKYTPVHVINFKGLLCSDSIFVFLSTLPRITLLCWKWNIPSHYWSILFSFECVASLSFSHLSWSISLVQVLPWLQTDILDWSSYLDWYSWKCELLSTCTISCFPTSFPNWFTLFFRSSYLITGAPCLFLGFPLLSSFF